MGMVLSFFDFSPDRDGLLRPIVFVNPDASIRERAKPLNLALARELQPIPLPQRARKMKSVVQKLVQKSPPCSVLSDFDVLFHPAYQVDVIQMFADVCKVHPFALLWPGRFDDGVLIYAECGRPDYKVFDISKYDITCVVQKAGGFH